MDLNALLTNKLNSTQINTLLDIKYPNSQTIIFNENNLDIVYQIIGLLNKVGYDQTLALMQGDSILKDLQLNKNFLIARDEGKSVTPTLTKADIDEALTYGASVFTDVYNNYQGNAKILREPTLESKGAVDCVKCGSGNTTSMQKQVRSADEPMSTFNRCKICNFKWKT
jgi:DNA-directed RNA polymerase subunit M/transcription elongation factor TFIIS